MLENWAFHLSGSDVVIAPAVHHSMCDFVDAEAKKRSLPISWRGERVDEVVQRFHHRLSGKVDRHAALAMTEERWLCSVLSPRAPDDNNLLYSVTARRLHAEVAVQTLTLT